MVYIDYRACITIIVHRIASAVQRQRRTTTDKIKRCNATGKDGQNKGDGKKRA